MDYKEKIIELLKENMTEKSFKLWNGINKRLPDIWSRYTSSTGKYHKKRNGEIPNVAEHTYEMLFSAVKISRLFDVNLKTTNFDKILFAIVLHDSLKYGTLGTKRHTDYKHDKYAADMVSENKKIFEKILTEEQFFVMEEAVRFHSGRWSTDVPRNQKFTFKDYNPETFFIHMLDMLSTADCLMTDMRD
jgi:23S rRNA maturation-related 3'-5' exoribonuclease YhaM